MAKQIKEKKHKSIEETLWDSANKLRGTVEPSEYKHVVLGLIFLKFASDKFEERKRELIAEGKDKYLKDKVEDDLPFYAMRNVFYIPENARWNYLIQNAKQDDIAIKIDTALRTVEKSNPVLKGAFIKLEKKLSVFAETGSDSMKNHSCKKVLRQTAVRWHSISSCT
ncbi:MAG: type I restriction-modification system subunit M N-terminal domain-containing protein [Bacteroidales bacterium]|nr:type I restriction-modification system subunit M N-terminal domain-containing protein [Bacteroidales bacterium]